MSENKVKSVRASRVPLLLACSASHADGAMQIDVDNDASPLGSAVHDANKVMITEDHRADLNKIAEDWGLSDLGDLEYLVSVSTAQWEWLKQYFPNPIVEHAMSLMLTDTLELTGTMDVGSVGEDWVVVNDWKTGYRRKDFYFQMLAYALLMCMTFNRQNWSVTVTWVRDSLRDSRSGKFEDLKWFSDAIIKAHGERNDSKYRINDLCENCPRFGECPARSALIRRTAADIAGVEGDFDTLRSMGASLAETYVAVRSIASKVELWLEQLRTEIRSGGPIDLGDGRMVQLKTIEKDVLDPQKTWPVAAQYLPDESDLAKVVRISKTSLLDQIGSKAPKGKIGAMKKKVMDDLNAAGAVSKRSEDRLEITKKEIV